MNSIDRQDFLEYVKSREGERLRTLKGDESFTVRATKTGVRYTPMPNMKLRSHPKKVVNHGLDRFEELGSININDLWYFTHCFSCTLSLIKSYLAQRGLTEAQ